MKIALIGYGKMGKTIEQIALERGHEIVLRIDMDNKHDLAPAILGQADAAIEFTRPESAVGNILACFEAGVPVVSGTTGWLDEWNKVTEVCASKQGGLFYASNYSIGVNIFFRLNHLLAKLMQGQTQYKVEMEEIHHTQKLDAPSGTAITLAEGILAEYSNLQGWINETSTADHLGIVSKREGDVPGTHTITYSSAIDTIQITHEAHSRQGFALGAVLAAEWMHEKKGVYGMEQMLSFSL